MALTPEKREALKLARVRIEKKWDTFICNALRSIGDHNPQLMPAADELRKFVNGQVKVPRQRTAATLGKWQRRNGHGYRTIAQQRLDRLAWIDWMLDEQKEA
ncbi:hypothetical protein P4G95_08990 [Burkholderia vietnamiensis]|uniref:hypothetical protein n=1 Tax=Burkholderia vietnamiensis TaxID=60552 RepID=UPI0015934FE5|nr:hypothetical protein [Burkholderia vietnamiensis]WHU91013.1 hypothetical protein P4G95_08990 [Burkholderia vietnamiensis]